MKRWWLLNAMLLIAVVALASWVYLKPRSDGAASYTLSKLAAGEVRQIRVERKGDPAVVIRKNGDGWLITAPLSAPADPFQVQRLLAILGATPAHRLPATDLARFDLDQPLMRLTIDDEQFSFGAVNAVTREQYVLTGGAVYVVPPRYGAMVPVNLAQMIRKRLLAENEAPVRFEFPDFTVALSEGKWRVSPSTGELSQDDISRWVEAWHHAAALRAEPYSGGQGDAIKMELKDGKTLTLEILQRESEAAIARPDQKLLYHFAGEAAKRLLTPPGSVHPK